MKYSIISGSHRINSQSLKVAKYVQERLLKLGICDFAHIIDLAEKEVPFWDEGVWNEERVWSPDWSEIERNLKESEGFVIVSPDWAGMVPAKLKNFFLLASSNQLSHKPALLISVSAGDGGAYPISELRSSSYKNSKVCYLPEHLIIKRCNDVLNSFEKINGKGDDYIRKRIDYTLRMLQQYTKAFQIINIENRLYPYGM